MSITIKKEIEGVLILRNFLTNLLSDGLHYIADYGIDLTYSKKDYELAKENCILLSPCWEDVLTQMLIDGKKLTFLDIEGDGDMNADLTLESIDNGLKTLYGVNPTFTNAVNDFLEENGDAETCDTILQYLLYGEVVFG